MTSYNQLFLNLLNLCFRIRIHQYIGSLCQFKQKKRLSNKNSIVLLVAACSSQEFECVTSGECIPLEFVCDGEEDCVDGSDEERACGM